MSFTHTPPDADYATHFYGANHTAWLRVVKPDHVNTLCEQNAANPPAVLVINNPLDQSSTYFVQTDNPRPSRIHHANYFDVESELQNVEFRNLAPNFDTVKPAFQFLRSAIDRGQNVLIVASDVKNVANSFLAAGIMYDLASRKVDAPIGTAIKALLKIDPNAAPNLRILHFASRLITGISRDYVLPKCVGNETMRRNLIMAAEARWYYLQSNTLNLQDLRAAIRPATVCQTTLRAKLKKYSLLQHPGLSLELAKCALWLCRTSNVQSEQDSKPIKLEAITKKDVAEQVVNRRSREARALARAPR